MQSDIILGVIAKNGKLIVSVSADGCEWVNFLLREKDGEWKEYKLAPHPLYPSIFTGEVVFDSKKQYEYIFGCDKGYFLDDHARLVTGPLGYGKLPGMSEKTGVKERSIFSDTLLKVCSVENEEYDWKKDCRPFVKASDMVIYKLHVRGFTIHESSKIKHPGTFKGIEEKLPYLKNLGITTIILQPCTEFNELMDFHINVGAAFSAEIQRSRVFLQPAETVPASRLNFWGYGAQGMYFAPKAAYASEPEKAVKEFKHMVRSLHSAGIEVIMEMDYNRGVTDGFILENLRFWALEYHIDGFRVNADRLPMKLLLNDEFLRNVKFLCRDFNDEFSEKGNVRDRIFVMNDGFQDCIRRFLKGDEGQLVYASNLIKDNGARFARINYVADHDGFTLNDVFSYDERHNEANGEGNRDGREANYSWNCGAEGATKKRKVLDLRSRMIKNALTLLFLSQGVPMLSAGDEFGNTHEGNNNPYCCDNEQGWVIWNKTKKAIEIKSFVSMLIKIRKEHPVFRNEKFLSGNDFEFTGSPDISFHGTKAWYPDFGYYSRTLGIMLNGAYALHKSGKTGEGKKDTSFLILINTHWEAHEFMLPVVNGHEWDFVFSTHPMLKGGIRSGREQKELVLPRTICLYQLKAKAKQTLSEDGSKVLDDEAIERTYEPDIKETEESVQKMDDANDEKTIETDGMQRVLEESKAKTIKKNRGIRPDLDEETA